MELPLRLGRKEAQRHGGSIRLAWYAWPWDIRRAAKGESQDEIFESLILLRTHQRRNPSNQAWQIVSSEIADARGNPSIRESGTLHLPSQTETICGSDLAAQNVNQRWRRIR